MIEKKVDKNENLIIGVKDNQLIFNGNLEGSAMIIPCSEGTLKINGMIATEAVSVTAKDEIIYNGINKDGEKSINLELNENKTEAYINISYENKQGFTLVDKNCSNILVLEAKEVKLSNDNYYREEEIVRFLRENGVIFGIQYSNIAKIANKEVTKYLVAKGLLAIDDEEDSLELQIKQNNIEEKETLEKIDFKSLNHIQSVKVSDIIGVIKKGKIGKNGINVLGKQIIKKNKKNFSVQCESGCIIKDDKVIATIDGRPVVKGNKVSVNSLYSVTGNVDIHTGNIEFLGDVNITGDIKEGMKVKAKGNIEVQGNVYNSNVESSSTVTIQGNVVHSKIVAGYASVIKETLIMSLEKLKSDISKILTNIVYLKEKNIAPKQYSDGELIKTLIETKFQSLNNECMVIISNYIKEGITSNTVINIIKSKLIGSNILKINNYLELADMIRIIDEKIINLKEELSIKYDVNANYCQECIIKATGDINITGKGVYTSQLESFNDIKIIGSRTVCRGGNIKAKNKIEIERVGSEGGVKTLVEVQKNGHIYLKKAYRNTIIAVGGKKFVIEQDSRDVHAYINKSELIVDKLLL